MAKQWHQLEKLDHKALKKLQAEREKQRLLNQKAEEQKRLVVIGVIILTVMFMIGGFGVIIKKRSEDLAIKEAREKLYNYTVIEVKEKPEIRKIGFWEPVKENDIVSENCSFRTSEKDLVGVQSHLNNQIKAMGNTEFSLFKPVLAENENKVEKETAELTTGEITVIIDLEGRDMLYIKVPGATVFAKSGLFKVLYDRDKDYGEVVVKNGLVEVKSDNGTEVKVSGFYKVSFSSKKVENPVQASVIKYDWR